ncbi:MAG: hypothetical protein WBI20_13510 [Burkholderiaceae bacterium]
MNKTLHSRPSLRQQRGAGLIEVLVAILVLAVGMLAMGKMSGLLIRDGGTANNRAIAISLAQQKLDDLRSFKWVSFPNPDGATCGSGIFCYSEIGNNTGGSKNGNSLVYPAGTVQVGNTTFSRNWVVAPNTQFNLLTVTISWTDKNGNGTEILQTALLADDASITAFGAAGPGAALPGPKVVHTAGTAPDVVPITLAEGLQRESSKPIPDVSQHGHSTVVGFQTTNYATSGSQKDTQEEFSTLSCICEFEAANTRQGMTATRKVWNPDTKELEFELGESIAKVTGRKPTTGQAANQPQLCDTCCRDHHDVSTSYPKYDHNPTGIIGGDHQHYRAVAGSLVAVSSGEYLEACRFERINGLFYLMQDWRLADLIVMPKDNYLSNTSTLASYQAYLQNQILFNALAVGTEPDKNTLPDRNTLNLAQGAQAQLLARGLYIDPIYQCRPGAVGVLTGRICPSGNNPTALDTTYTSNVSAMTSPDVRLKHIPFNEVNLTMLATWGSNETSWISVDNQPVQDIVDPVSGFYTTYYRGRVTGLASSGAAIITATARTSNTGVTSGVQSASGNADGYGTDPNDDTSTKTDSISVNSLGTISTWGISGDLVLTFNNPVNPNKPKPTSWGATATTGSISCSSTGNPNNPGYSCTVPDGWSGTITPFASSSGGGGNDALGTLYYFSPSSRSHSNVSAAATSQNFKLCKDSTLCPP